MNGWIKLHRKLLGTDLWLKEPFTKGQAWVDLIGLANHEPGFIRVRGNRIEVRRGQVGWSQERLAERWKWSRKKVSNFLRELASDYQVEVIAGGKPSNESVSQNNPENQPTRPGQKNGRRNNLSSIITIVNYELYQKREQQRDPQKNGRRPAEERQKNADKKEKKNGKEKKLFVPPSLEDVTAYCVERNNGVDPRQWWDSYQAKGWMIGRSPMKDWRAAVRTWEQNGRQTAQHQQTLDPIAAQKRRMGLA